MSGSGFGCRVRQPDSSRCAETKDTLDHIDLLGGHSTFHGLTVCAYSMLTISLITHWADQVLVGVTMQPFASQRIIRCCDGVVLQM